LSRKWGNPSGIPSKSFSIDTKSLDVTDGAVGGIVGDGDLLMY